MAGTGPDQKKLKQLIKSQKINNIELLGYLNQSKLSRTISNSSFIVVPSLWYENMPYSILEAFAHGKPVVASKIGGIPEIVRSGKNGFLVEPGKSKEFAKKIQFLWNRPKLLKKLGLRAKNDVENKYNSQMHYNKLMGLYKMTRDGFDDTI
jgi:glycosyltransferase involved in cell wall biosynthesis